MSLRHQLTTFALFLGDVVALYCALFLTLWIRYGNGYYAQFTDAHAMPFGIIFLLWIIIFYVAGLYDLRRLQNNLAFFKTLFTAIIISFLLAIGFFYLIPTLITPKTNLLLVTVLFACIEIVWRRLFNRRATLGEAPNKILLIGGGGTTESIYETIMHHPQLGYEIKAWIRKELEDLPSDDLHAFVKEHAVNLIVIPRTLKHDAKLMRPFYELLNLGVEIRDLPGFYELLFQKVPLSDIEEAWFLENLIGQQKFYDQLKRAGEFMLALILFIVLFPIELFLLLLIRLTSPGPAIYRQVRIGKHGKRFTLYKFRTMRNDAEKHGAQWATTRDVRVTPLGKLLRYSHLDELPQLINVMRGELSFVGPRPERPEFVKVLEPQVPYYDIRHLVNPGITGWAQINYRYGASIQDSYAKLEYDIYYLKNQSFVLDVAIILKTLKSFFINHR